MIVSSPLSESSYFTRISIGAILQHINMENLGVGLLINYSKFVDGFPHYCVKELSEGDCSSLLFI